MALINCPECNNEISDKAVHCPHCGYPVSHENKEILYHYNGDDYDISEVYNHIHQKKKLQAIKIFIQITGADLGTARNIVENLRANSSTKCPNCGHTEFDIVKRNLNILNVFMTNNVNIVCRSCKTKF